MTKAKPVGQLVALTFEDLSDKWLPVRAFRNQAIVQARRQGGHVQIKGANGDVRNVAAWIFERHYVRA